MINSAQIDLVYRSVDWLGDWRVLQIMQSRLTKLHLKTDGHFATCQKQNESVPLIRVCYIGIGIRNPNRTVTFHLRTTRIPHDRPDRRFPDRIAAQNR